MHLLIDVRMKFSNRFYGTYVSLKNVSDFLQEY